MELHEKQGVQRVESLDQLDEVDAWARGVSREFIAAK